MSNTRQPNVVFVFADQWRGQATGYAGDPNARTPHLDALERRSVNFINATAGCPVCSPYRASLLTGRHPLSHGVFMNDLHLDDRSVSIAQAFRNAGYDTAYIGKWHVDGRGRSNFIPRERRQGFEFWKVLECTHDYNNSCYYADAGERLIWSGYDAISQTREASRYVAEHPGDRPFLLMLSWGPPHAPYYTAPERYRSLFREEAIVLRPNVPEGCAEEARSSLMGYYAHIAALDDCLGQLLAELDENTVFVFTSDHGDMHGSQGQRKKQHPYDESVSVPFLLHWPAGLGRTQRRVKTPIDAPDIMPTLLGLCGVAVPHTVEGSDLSPLVRGEDCRADDAVVIACYAPFGQYSRAHGGREYRGIRTTRHTYVRDLDGPWLLFDNHHDPYQLDNLCNRSEHAGVQAELDARLLRALAEVNDEFLPAEEYIRRWGYEVDGTGTVPYTD
jgi:arylsulfatase A-like enzyme